MHIRLAEIEDAPALAKIYNYAIEHTVAAWLSEPVSISERENWLGTHVTYVAEIDGQVVGFAGFGQWRPSPGYRFTVENSIYIDPDFHGRGIASELLSTLIDAAKAANLKVMVAGIEARNEASIRLHEKFGFVEVGRLPGVGFKREEFLDLILLQLDL